MAKKKRRKKKRPAEPAVPPVDSKPPARIGHLVLVIAAFAVVAAGLGAWLIFAPKGSPPAPEGPPETPAEPPPEIPPGQPTEIPTGTPPEV